MILITCSSNWKVHNN